MSVKPKLEDYGGINPTALKKQYEDLRDYADELVAQVRALGGTPKRPNDPFDSLELLERVALALAAADEAAVAMRSVPFDPSGRHHTPHPNDRGMPGSTTRSARYRRDKLVHELEVALSSWDFAKQHDFHPPKKDQAPKVRCRRRDCSRYDRRVPAWDFNGVPNEFCAGCGERLPAPEVAA